MSIRKFALRKASQFAQLDVESVQYSVGATKYEKTLYTGSRPMRIVDKGEKVVKESF